MITINYHKLAIMSVAVSLLGGGIWGMSNVQATSNNGENTQHISTRQYTVKPGDTVYQIGRQHGLTVSEMTALNDIPDSFIIHPGDVLSVSSNTDSHYVQSSDITDDYTVVAGDYPYKIANRFGLDVYDVLRWNNLTTSSIIYPGDQLVLKPHHHNAQAIDSLEYQGELNDITIQEEKGVQRVHELTHHQFDDSEYIIIPEHISSTMIQYDIAENHPSKITVFKRFRYDIQRDIVFEAMDSGLTKWKDLSLGESSVEQHTQNSLIEEAIQKFNESTQYRYAGKAHVMLIESTNLTETVFSVMTNETNKATPVMRVKFNHQKNELYSQSLDTLFSQQWTTINE